MALNDLAGDLSCASAHVHVHARSGHTVASGLKSGGELDALITEQMQLGVPAGAGPAAEPAEIE